MTKSTPCTFELNKYVEEEKKESSTNEMHISRTQKGTNYEFMGTY